jgi:uncharacterized membrane protein YqhA
VKTIERLFEGALWNSRCLVLIAVVASVLLAIGVFYVASVDAAFMLHDVTRYAALDQLARDATHAKILAHVAEIVDGYLFAAIMIIFGFGLYELFISRIDAAENSHSAPRLLLIRTLDDLKERLAKVVFLILIVRYFEYALQSEISGPLDLLYLAVGIALIATSLYLTGRSAGHAPSSEKSD